MGKQGRGNQSEATPYVLFDTAMGTCAIAWRQGGLARVQLPEANLTKARTQLRRSLGPVEDVAPPRAIRQTIRLIQQHLSGKMADFTSVELDMSGVSPFAQRVYGALRQVGTGSTVSYGELAAQIGSPGGARAVGGAVGRNPWSLVVPCHRVLAAQGKLGGFSAHGGAVTKARLLTLEGIALAPTKKRRAAPLQPPGRQPLFDGDGSLPFDEARARRALSRADPKLAALMKRVGPFGLKLKRPQSTFAALAEAMVYQQLTAKAAATIFARVLELFPRRRALHPEDIASTSDSDLRSAGLSRSKTAGLHDLARKTLAGQVPDLRKLRRMDDEAIIETLTTVRGVGRWTAEMLLIFQLGRPDVLASGDWGLRKGLARMLGSNEPPSVADFEAYGERWRPYRTMASWYLWRALEE